LEKSIGFGVAVVGLIVSAAWVSPAAHAYKFKRECIVITGPVDLRDAAGGKVVRSIPDGSTVFAEESVPKPEDGWLRVRSFRGQDKSIRCSHGDELPGSELSGWVPRSARKDLPRAEALEIDRLGLLQGWMSESGDYSSPDRAAAKVETVCGVFSRSPRRPVVTGVTQVFVAGAEIGKECVEGDDAVTCRVPQTGGTDYTVCLRSDVQTKSAKSLSAKDRRAMLEEAAKDARNRVNELVGDAFLAKVAAKYPNWLPLVAPHPKRNNDYIYDLALMPSAAKARFAFKDGKAKERQVLLFYASAEDAIAEKPTLAFEYGTEVEFRPLAQTLAPAHEPRGGPAWEDRPSVCLASSGEFLSLNACRVLEDRSEWMWSVDFRQEPPASVEEDDMKKALGRLKSGVCCSWNDKKYIQLLPKKD
jgi:hypothetical protein